MSLSTLPKIIVILGPTASGKTTLAIKLAGRFNGEIVSADSRQVYKEFDIGTAKPEGHWMIWEGKRQFVAGGVLHHLVDITDPKEDFTLADYKALAVAKINEIHGRGKLPFLVGGTALYLKAVLENWSIPQVESNPALRAKLEHKKTEDLFNELQKKDPEAASITGNRNKRRIIRALEVIRETGRKFSEQRKAGRPIFDALKIGLAVSRQELAQRVAERTNQMIRRGLIEEAWALRKKYPWTLVPMQSIDYQEFREYFEGQRTLMETVRLINKNHLGLARRQMTWFKKDKATNWVPADLELAFAQATNLIQTFLKT